MQKPLLFPFDFCVGLSKNHGNTFCLHLPQNCTVHQLPSFCIMFNCSVMNVLREIERMRENIHSHPIFDGMPEG